MNVESKTKSTQEHKWGVMPPQDMPGQLTRSMVEMRKPKAYELKELPSLPAHAMKCEDVEELCFTSCPLVLHSIQLMTYIKQAKSLVSKLENKTIYGHTNRIDELSQPPVFESHKFESTLPDRSSSHGDSSSSSLFSAPDLEHEFRDGKARISSPEISEGTANRILKSSVLNIIAHSGFEEVQSSCLNVLGGITRMFMVKFSKLLRDALDHEAESGHPPFYDVLGSVLIDSGIKSLEELRLFWNSKVVKRHQMLQQQALKVSQEVQSLKFRMREVKMETVHIPRSRYGKWTPVAGMRSGPDYGHAANSSHLASVKTEYPDSYGTQVLSEFSSGDRRYSQENPFDFDENPDSLDPIEFDHRQTTPRKKSRNAL